MCSHLREKENMYLYLDMYNISTRMYKKVIMISSGKETGRLGEGHTLSVYTLLKPFMF